VKNEQAIRDPAVRRFILFRVFFNARYYYPIFTVLFLDFGLSLEQFAILNTIWAATIVLAEVPSGALADIIGRKRLVCCSAWLMIIELALLCWVPLRDPEVVADSMDYLFVIFAINRILSGLSEAAASGADEALTFDALKAKGLDDQWPAVLGSLMRMQSVAFFFTMIIGALIYDPEWVGKAATYLGFEGDITQAMTIRWPLYLTLINAFIALSAALSMSDPAHSNTKFSLVMIVDSCKKTMHAGKWIMATPFALIVILTGLTFDGVLRMFITLSSEYYRTIELPDASFGFIGAGIALLGILVSKAGEYMTRNHSPAFNLSVMSILTLLAFIGISQIYPVYGLIFAVLTFEVIRLLNFFLSHYLNRIVASDMRATVLSFKNLALNVGYGFAGLAYAYFIAALQGSLPEKTAE